MKKSLFSALAALALLTVTTSASAQTATPGITARQHSEQARIRQGVRSGQLTPVEAARLRTREADIREDKREAKADGVVTHEERHELRKDENQASRAIYRQKHDAQVRRRIR